MKLATQSEVKSALVAAHRARDWPLAARLSQEKERLKKRLYCLCGVRINKGTVRCIPCNVRHRFYPNAIAALVVLALSVVCLPAATMPPIPGSGPTRLLSPKARETSASMGAPMAIIVPPAFTNLALFASWSGNSESDSYWLYVGTNWTSPLFATNTTATSCRFTLRVRDDTENLYAWVRGHNSEGASDVMVVARFPDWQPNAVRVSWTPPIPAWLLQTWNMKTWQATQQTPPVTIPIVKTEPIHFFKAIEVNQTNQLRMDIAELRLLNTNAVPPHYGE